ncbi:MAG: protein kinase [Actinomycetota bacterium]|nr:protein kinase [Actinomycetota bacterium]
MSSPLDRYRLIDELLVPDRACAYWRAYDTALDREVVIRLIHAQDPRAEILNVSARAAAVVQDRRLGQILDVMEVPAEGAHPKRLAVVNEWVQGESLLSLMAARDWNPLGVQQAIRIVTEVAQALLLAHDHRVRHGRLLASNVLLTDAAEVRVIGMSIDAVILGGADDQIRGDIDSLGGLLYFMLTGNTPFAVDPFGPADVQAPIAPRHRSYLEPASHVRADIPHDLDVLIARSMIEQRRPRGTTKFRTVGEFLSALTQIRTSLEPVAGRPTSTRVRTLAVRFTVALALIAAVALLVVAWRQLYIGPYADSSRAQPSPSASPSPAASANPTAVSVRLPALAVDSFDPFGDDNRDGVDDAAAGREHQNQAQRAIDGNPATSWNSLRYRDATANGKGGVGLVVDLGESQQVQSVGIRFVDVGSAVRIAVSDSVLAQPVQWPLLAKAPAGKKQLAIRSPRPVQGRYVLVWFPRLPPSVSYPDMHQVQVSEVVIRGRG